MPYNPNIGKRPGTYIPGLGTFGGDDSVLAPWVREVPGVIGDAASEVGQFGKNVFKTGAAMHGYGSYPTPDPIRTAQQNVLDDSNKLNQHDTPTPVKANALAKPAMERSTSSDTGQKQATSTGLTQGAFGESGIPWRPGYTPSKPSDSHMQVKLSPALLEQMKTRQNNPMTGDEITARFGTPDAKGYSEYKPDRSSDAGSASELDWEKVANPMAFEGYREGPERKLLEMQTKDPFAAQREQLRIAAALDSMKADQQASRDVETYRSKHAIDEQGQANVEARYGAIANAQAADVAELESSPEYKLWDPEKQQRKRNELIDKWQSQKDAMDSARAKLTGKVGAS